MSEGILLDTVTFVEYLQGTLPSSIRETVDQADRRCLSVITPWEVHLKKVLRERIRPIDIKMAIDKMGLEIRTVLLEHLWFLGQMPEFEDHRDPFDRLLIAQSLEEGVPLMTADAWVEDYQLRTIW